MCTALVAKHTKTHIYAFAVGALERVLTLIFTGPAKSIPVVAKARASCMRALGKSPMTGWRVSGLVFKQITHLFTIELAIFLPFNGQY